MALRYTGAADPFVHNGKEYHPGDMVPISKALAEHHMAQSNLHTFEDAEGDPIAEPAPVTAGMTVSAPVVPAEAPAKK